MSFQQQQQQQPDLFECNIYHYLISLHLYNFVYILTFLEQSLTKVNPIVVIEELRPWAPKQSRRHGRRDARGRHKYGFCIKARGAICSAILTTSGATLDSPIVSRRLDDQDLKPMYAFPHPKFQLAALGVE